MNWIKNWLGITALEKRNAGMEEVINHLVIHLTEARENIDKLAEIVLAYQSKTWVQTEIPIIDTTIGTTSSGNANIVTINKEEQNIEDSILEEEFDEKSDISDVLTKERSKYMTIRDWVKAVGYLSVGGIRHLIFTNKDFAERVCRKIGKKILLDTDELDQWVSEQTREKHTTTKSENAKEVKLNGR